MIEDFSEEKIEKIGKAKILAILETKCKRVILVTEENFDTVIIDSIRKENAIWLGIELQYGSKVAIGPNMSLTDAAKQVMQDSYNIELNVSLDGTETICFREMTFNQNTPIRFAKVVVGSLKESFLTACDSFGVYEETIVWESVPKKSALMVGALDMLTPVKLQQNNLKEKIE